VITDHGHLQSEVFGQLIGIEPHRKQCKEGIGVKSAEETANREREFVVLQRYDQAKIWASAALPKVGFEFCVA
jgi:hypothetical protein